MVASIHNNTMANGHRERPYPGMWEKMEGGGTWKKKKRVRVLEDRGRPVTMQKGTTRRLRAGRRKANLN